MLNISRIHHINIRSTPEKMDATRDFYRDLLGMEEGYRQPFKGHGYWMWRDNHPWVHISTTGPKENPVLQPESMDAGFGHIAFDSTGYQDFKDLLAEKGMKYEEHPTPDKDMMQIFFPDPNGVVVEMVFAIAEVEAAKAAQSVAAAE
jgi:catechol 2,3-dioxygenase-like lactoylglutathione lyase family enzyme